MHDPLYFIPQIPGVVKEHTGEDITVYAVRLAARPKDKGGGGTLVADEVDALGHQKFRLSTILAWRKHAKTHWKHRK